MYSVMLPHVLSPSYPLFSRLIFLKEKPFAKAKKPRSSNSKPAVIGLGKRDQKLIKTGVAHINHGYR